MRRAGRQPQPRRPGAGRRGGELGNTNVVVATGRPGTYCFRGLSFAPKHIVASIDGNFGAGAGDAQPTIGTGPGCPSGTQAVVYTINNANPGQDSPYTFYVLFN